MSSSAWADGVALATRILPVLARSGQTMATAESLTGGLVAGAVTSVAGASRVFRGGVVAYQSDLKNALVGVDAALLTREGPVSPTVAAALAAGARHRLAATWGVSTTGVAGPEPVDDNPVGTVFVAAAGPAAESRVARLAVAGSRDEIRLASVVGCLRLLAQCLGVDAGGAPGACEAGPEAHDRIDHGQLRHRRPD